MPALTSPFNKALPLRGVTAAAYPALAGRTVYEGEVPFRLAVPSGAPGKLDLRVVRSSRTGLLDFQYRLSMTDADCQDTVRLSVTFSLHG